MKIELMRMIVRGRELLNIKLETRKHSVGGYNDYFQDLTAKTVWNDEKADDTLFMCSPVSTSFGVRLKKCYVMVLLEVSIELTKGSFEIALHGNLMQDEDVIR